MQLQPVSVGLARPLRQSRSGWGCGVCTPSSRPFVWLVSRAYSPMRWRINQHRQLGRSLVGKDIGVVRAVMSKSSTRAPGSPPAYAGSRCSRSIMWCRIGLAAGAAEGGSTPAAALDLRRAWRSACQREAACRGFLPGRGVITGRVVAGTAESSGVRGARVRYFWPATTAAAAIPRPLDAPGHRGWVSSSTCFLPTIGGPVDRHILLPYPTRRVSR